MIGENIAVLDLGTNSFHLLIAKIEDHDFEELVKKKHFVHLAAGGMNVISEEKFALGLQVLLEFKEKMNEYNVRHCRVFATAGLRNATNSEAFQQAVMDRVGLRVEVISGDREAELIYKGVREAVHLNSRPRLLMDIGGGSVEFVIANQKEIFWKASFPIGAQVLKSKFHKHEPIQLQEYQSMVAFLEEKLQPLWEQIELYKPVGLIGSSGSFMSLVNMQRGFNTIFPILEGKSEIVNLTGFRYAHLSMLKSTLEERLQISEIEPGRAPLMVVSTTLMSIVINHLQPERSITVSHYALKEGMLFEMKEARSQANA